MEVMPIRPFPAIPLLDGFANVVAKAQQGNRLNDATLSSLAGVSVRALGSILEGRGDEKSVRAVCTVLGLHVGSVLEIMEPNSVRPDLEPIDGVAMFNTQYNGFTVNSYLGWDPVTKEGFIIDTGGDADDLLTLADSEQVKVRAVLLTHTHIDHILCLEDILDRHDVPVYVSEFGFQDGWVPFSPGKVFQFGNLKVTCLHTWGHSSCGTTYYVEGLSRPVAFTGDALLARSIGAAPSTYHETLNNIRVHLLSLPKETLLLPGHGPTTTVGEERRHNPFFPEFKAEVQVVSGQK